MRWHLFRYSRDNFLGSVDFWEVDSLNDDVRVHIDEWEASLDGYFFLPYQRYGDFRRQCYKRYRDWVGGSLRGHLYTSDEGRLERDVEVDGTSVQSIAYVVTQELPDEGIDDIDAWVQNNAKEWRLGHVGEAFHKWNYDGLIPKTVRRYFQEHLEDDPPTRRMLDFLFFVERCRRSAGGKLGRRDVFPVNLSQWQAAMFHNALNVCQKRGGWSIERAKGLPFEMNSSARAAIDGWRTKAAFEEHCSEWLEHKEAAATFSTLKRHVEGKSTPMWLDEAFTDVCAGGGGHPKLGKAFTDYDALQGAGCWEDALRVLGLRL